MEDFERATAVDSESVVGGLSPRMVVGGFAFPAPPVINTTVIDDFKHERPRLTSEYIFALLVLTPQIVK